MKQLLLAILLLFQVNSFAQKFEINPYAGFTFGGQVIAEDGKLDFHSSANGGLNLAYFFNDKHGVSFDYTLQSTQVDVWYTAVSNDKDVVDINLSWFQVGYIYNTNFKKLEPFVGFYIGGTYIKPRETQMYPATIFSLSGFAGIDYDLTETFGFRFTGKFLYPAGFSKELEYQSKINGQRTKFESNFVQGSLNLGIFFRI